MAQTLPDMDTVAVPMRSRPHAQALKIAIWSVVLAWLLLAAGQALVFGNAVVMIEGAWIMASPSLWARGLSLWAGFSPAILFAFSF